VYRRSESDGISAAYRLNNDRQMYGIVFAAERRELSEGEPCFEATVEDPSTDPQLGDQL
jgi:hypothetical protein